MDESSTQRKYLKRIVDWEVLVLLIPALVVLAVIISRRYQESKKLSNDVRAVRVLRALDDAVMQYAKEHRGQNPRKVDELVPYVGKNYCGAVVGGFRFSCEFRRRTYQFMARPVDMGKTGTRVFALTIGGDIDDEYIKVSEDATLNTFSKTINNLFYRDKSFAKTAQEIAKALGYVEKEYGSTSLEAAEYIGQLGAVYRLLGKEKKGLSLLNKARSIRKKYGQDGAVTGIQSDAFFEFNRRP